MSMVIPGQQYEYNVNNQNLEDSMSFNNIVLQHIKNNKPDATLEQLLTEMKELSPEVPVIMQTLNSALLYSDTMLRSDPDYIEYTNDVLDNRTCQLLGLNMFINNMLNNMFSHRDEDS